MRRPWKKLLPQGYQSLLQLSLALGLLRVNPASNLNSLLLDGEGQGDLWTLAIRPPPDELASSTSPHYKSMDSVLARIQADLMDDLHQLGRYDARERRMIHSQHSPSHPVEISAYILDSLVPEIGPAVGGESDSGISDTEAPMSDVGESDIEDSTPPPDLLPSPPNAASPMEVDISLLMHGEEPGDVLSEAPPPPSQVSTDSDDGLLQDAEDHLIQIEGQIITIEENLLDIRDEFLHLEELAAHIEEGEDHSTPFDDWQQEDNLPLEELLERSELSGDEMQVGPADTTILHYLL